MVLRSKLGGLYLEPLLSSLPTIIQNPLKLKGQVEER
jgi:hypothetical protein